VSYRSASPAARRPTTASTPQAALGTSTPLSRRRRRCGRQILPPATAPRPAPL